MACLYQAAHVDMQARHGDGSSHEVPVRVAEDIALARCDLRVLPKESELVAHLRDRANTTPSDADGQPFGSSCGTCRLAAIEELEHIRHRHK